MTDHSDRPIGELVAGAVTAMRSKQHHDALDLSKAVLERQPDHAGASAVAFTTLFTTGNLEEARLMGDRAAALNPNSEYILNNQACLQLEAKQPVAACQLLESLIDHHGERPQWLYNLGLALRMRGEHEQSIAVFQRALDLQPTHDKAAFQLVDLYLSLGKPELGTRQVNYLRLLRPNFPPTHAQYLHQAAISAMVTSSDLDLDFRLWGDRFIPKDKNYPPAKPQDLEKLRIGFIVGVIPASWWSLMVVPVIKKLSEQDAVFVYWHDPKDHTSQLNSGIKVLPAAEMSDAQFARQVREDQIDVLVDVCGMRRGCRQRALGLQLVSQQLGWLAHEGFYATHLVTPIEQLLGESRFCFSNDERFNSDDSSGGKAISNKTFFGVNAFAGLTEVTVKTWAEILLATDGWMLQLDVEQAELQNQLQQQFSNCGLNAERITFDQQLLPGNGSVLLENLADNDVLKAYTGLRRGAAVVALQGELFPAQQTSALLIQIGQTDWIAGNRYAYKDKAIQLAKDETLSGVPQEQLENAGMHEVSNFTTRFRKILSGQN